MSAQPKFDLVGFLNEVKSDSKRVAKSTFSKVAATGVALYGAAANAAVTMPTPDYTDIEAAAVVGFAIVLTVGLLMKAKRFFR